MLMNYSSVGFSTDSLIRYKKREVSKLVTRIFLGELHEKFDWPEYVTEFDFDDFDMDMLFSNAVWDLKTGCILKLSGKMDTVKAIHGTDILKDEEVQKLYGKPPTYK